MIFPLLVLLILTIQCEAKYWHVYDSFKMKQEKSKTNCSQYEKLTKPLHQLVQEYQLWPNVSIPSNAPPSPSSVVYGLEYTLDYLWKHQHPPKEDCKHQTFVINGVHNGGFGSELHVHGAVFGEAINLNRIFLWNPHTHAEVRWEVDNPFCSNNNNQHNLECYYHSASSCTIYDALGSNAVQILREATQWTRDGAFSNELFITAIKTQNGMLLDTDPGARKSFMKVHERYKVIYIRNPGWLKHGSVPQQFLPLLRCSPMRKDLYYYWWRAMSMVYLMRPNEQVQEWLYNHRLQDFEKAISPSQSTTDGQPNNEDFISLYIRRGDKSIEMRLPDLSEFTHALHLLRKEKITDTKIVFLASEDSRVIKSMKEWDDNHHNKYKLFWTEVFDRSGLLAERSEAERKKASNHPAHHPEEYLSMLLNIHYLIQGSVQICTLSSNFCRIIDELRATVGGRADKVYIDLSIETCNKTPCINGNISQLFWR